MLALLVLHIGLLSCKEGQPKSQTVAPFVLAAVVMIQTVDFPTHADPLTAHRMVCSCMKQR